MTCNSRLRFALSLICLVGCRPPEETDTRTPSQPAVQTPTRIAERSVAQRLGAVYTNAPKDLVPRITRLELPDDLTGIAIWGATGRDDDGNIYFGVTTAGDDTATVWKLAPGTDSLIRAGNVSSALQQTGAARPGEKQLKIHSKLFQADDGWVYFSSMDETGEKEDGSVYPKWGGHLWRMSPSNTRWEHVFRSREALIAVAGSGRWIFALGYFNHVLYAYDTQTGEAQETVVGSVGGHISRLFLADALGHAYVPRVTKQPNSHDYAVSLVQFSSELKEIAATPLRHYNVTPDANSFGITAYTHLRDGRVVFATSTGHLYQITPSAQNKPSAVNAIGWFHPDGKALTTSLFTFAGERYVVGVAERPDGATDWVTYDLSKQQSFAASNYPGQDLLREPKLNIYGTHTRDDFGNFYLVGRRKGTTGREPVILRVTVR